MYNKRQRGFAVAPNTFASSSKSKSDSTASNLTKTVATVAVSAGVLFLTIWVVSKGWKAGQKTA
jgi:hypothetical protein